MRRYWKSSLFSFLMILIAIFVVVNQKFSLGGNEIGSDAVLGLKLGLDLQGGSHLVYQSDLKNENGESIPPDKNQMEALIKTIERRVNSSGLGEPIIQLLGDDRLLIQLPGITDPERAKNLIGETARLEFKHRFTDASDPVDEVINELMKGSGVVDFENVYDLDLIHEARTIVNRFADTQELKESHFNAEAQATGKINLQQRVWNLFG